VRNIILACDAHCRVPPRGSRPLGSRSTSINDLSCTVYDMHSLPMYAVIYKVPREGSRVRQAYPAVSVSCRGPLMNVSRMLTSDSGHSNGPFSTVLHYF